ncbi:hypothetical protein [Streptomyces sp. B21-083]|uniref:hypothetical protein n=1 Tax=Streptomyces sp. B21-083 TaxID=3039410 RepID=UPI002FF3F63A
MPPTVAVSEATVTVVSSTAVAEEVRVQVAAAVAALVRTVTSASSFFSVKVVPVSEPVRVRDPAPVCGSQPPPLVAVNATEPPSAPIPPESMVRAYSVCQPLAGLMLLVCVSPPVPLVVSSFLPGRDASSRPHLDP